MPDVVQPTPVIPPAATAPAAVAPPVETQAPAPGNDAFAALASKERAHVAERQKLAAEREALAKDRDAHKSELAEFQEWKAAREQRLRAPAPFLEKDFGPDWYDKLTEFKLSGGKVTPELVAASVDERLAAYEKKQADEKAKAEATAAEQAKADHQAAWDKFTEDTESFIKAKPDDYELINLYGAHSRVIAVIEKTYTDTGRVLEAKEAADLVEADLLGVAKKSKKLGAQSPAAVPPPQGGTKPPESAQPRTLTNAAAPATAPAKPRPMTDEERVERAMQAAEAVRAARQPRA